MGETTGRMIKLLLAEDDNFSRDMLVRRLERNGFEVIAAVDGREAVQAARLQRPDLILLDLDMPVMDGKEAMEVLGGDPRTFRIPVIALAERVSPADIAEAARIGVQAVEAKPVVLKRLLGRIEEVLQTRARKEA